MRKDVVLYSAIYGDYDTVKPIPHRIGSAARCFMYTDSEDVERIAGQLGWITFVVPLPNLPTPMLRHKWWKMNPHAACGGADVTLWVDGSFEITVDDYVERCVNALGDDDFTTVPHPARTCIYDEAYFSAQLSRYDAQGLFAQSSYYNSLGHPRGWGLFATGANVRRITPASLELGKHWWYENLNRTHQDQVSLPVIMRIMGDRLKWNANMPWGEWWGIAPHLK